MIIKEKLVWDGNEYGVEYHDADALVDLPKLLVTQAYGVCFCNGKLLIGQRAKNGMWGHLGGSLEFGETPEQTLKREIQEESILRHTDLPAFWCNIGVQAHVLGLERGNRYTPSHETAADRCNGNTLPYMRCRTHNKQRHSVRMIVYLPPKNSSSFYQFKSPAPGQNTLFLKKNAGFSSGNAK
jgi:hypothetical protein